MATSKHPSNLFSPHLWEPTPKDSIHQWGPYDALTWAPCNDGVITSPNADYIPPYRPECADLVARADGRFGLHDPFHVPYEYHPRQCWIIAYPNKEAFQTHCFAVLWYTLSIHDVDFSASNSRSGVVKPSLLNLLAEASRFLSREAEPFIKGTDPRNADYMEADRPSLIAGRAWVADALDRVKSHGQALGSCAGDFRNLTLRLADLQRGMMDIFGFVHYWRFVGRAMMHKDWTYLRSPDFAPSDPKLDGVIIRASTKYVGAFCTNSAWASQLYRSGVPVWIPRNRNDISPSIKSLTMVSLKKYPHLAIEHSKVDNVTTPYPAVVKNWPMGPERAYMARYGYGNTAEKSEVVFGDPATSTRMNAAYNPKHNVASHQRKPYAGRHRSNNAGPSSGSSATSTKGVCTQPVTSRWKLDTSARLPGVHQTWSSACGKVDYSNPVSCPPFAGAFLIPDPNLFFGTQTTPKLVTFIRNWLSLRPALITAYWGSPAILSAIAARLPDRDPEVRGLSTQEWRHFLGGFVWLAIGVSYEGGKGKRPQSKVDQALARTQLCRLVDLDSVPQSTDQTVFNVRGHSISPEAWADPKDHLMRGLFWDLSDLGFATDVMALDALIMPADWLRDPSGRHARLTDIFPMPTQSVETRRDVLGADAASSHVRADKLRALMAEWPNSPPRLQSPITSTTGVVVVHMTIANHLFQRCHDRWRRPLTVPREVPPFFLDD
ncbi:hypothetical protein CONPUDRAFT_157262 [Coniophora puteana RWD-64-598 SS2]|uniref:Uncharacterized protein n=1 Tax=Coniophora puteana (strain RWD-64-598) TaxID=741705 RepID=A0A5M3MEF2_CONPW|nr:uncharacterized protein CONPUDRAFT_157262 [Coniophora puteana RWD-64-598 SS2]EIW76985.1 hypothetical protein CONPUDRAFT_157262 [Coniophora puteana RWD-64-598 SS2]